MERRAEKQRVTNNSIKGHSKLVLCPDQTNIRSTSNTFVPTPNL